MIKRLIFYFFVALASWGFFANSKIEFKFLNNNNQFGGATMPSPKYALHCRSFISYKAFDKATSCYKQALIGNENNTEIRYYLAVSMLEDKNYQGAMFHSDYILRNNPISPYARFARDLYVIAEKASRDKTYLETTASSDYLKDLAKIARWPRMPITVWIEHSDNDTNLRNAFHTWQTALYPTVSFQMVNNKKDAKLTVMYGKPNAHCESEFAIGCTVPYMYAKYPEYFHHVEIYLDYLMPNSVKITDREVYSVLVHEIGHALGMLGHSKNKSDIMYPDTSNYNRRPSRRDINTVRKIYGK